MTLLRFSLLAASSLFVIMDPISLAPAYLAMTPGDTAQSRIKMARLACLIAAVVLIAFALAGKWIFKCLGITMPAFKIAGSIVLLMIALDMLQARRSPVRQTAEETDAGAVKADIAVTPLAIPMLAGPGALSTTLLLQARAQGFAQQLALLVAIAAVSALCYWILRFAAQGADRLSPIAMKIATRIMGLLLAAVAVQFILDAISEQMGKLP